MFVFPPVFPRNQTKFLDIPKGKGKRKWKKKGGWGEGTTTEFSRKVQGGSQND